MVNIRNVIAVELHSIDEESIAYCEKEWVQDPWIRRTVEKAASKDAIAEAAPPLLPQFEPLDDWTQRDRRLPNRRF